MKEFRADLHCHTTCSDGTVAPDALIQLACDLNLQGLSITDHDTITAYKKAVPIAQAKNILLLSGLEISAIHLQTSVHILAYSFSLTSSTIQDFCQQHQERRRQRNQEILSLLDAKGMPLSLEDFPTYLSTPQSQYSLCRPHIASAMKKRGYVKSIQQAFQDYIGEGKPCYVPNNTFSVEKTIEIVHQANGLAIIAHPHLIEKVEILKDLLDMNFDGIEGYYARFPNKVHERWCKIGIRKGWLITGGSDFHGMNKPHLSLGCSWVNEETFTILYQRFQLNQGFSI